MWKPNYVVAENKTRANVVWNILLASIIGILIWNIVTVVKKYRDPSTSFTVSDDVYRFPYMEVCFDLGSGCDAAVLKCAASVIYEISDPCSTAWDVRFSSEETFPNCVTFQLGDVETEEFLARGCTRPTQRPSLDLKMIWNPIHGAGGDEEYSSSVSVYLGGADVLQLTSVPYNRIVVAEEGSASEVRVSRTDMTIGKSIKKPLSGDSLTSYPTLTLSSTEYVSSNQTTFFYYQVPFISEVSSSNQSTNTSAGDTLAYMYLSMSLGSFSLTTLSEDDPINIPDFISNLGGFWEVLLLGWGFFFIATRDTTPVQKARSFEEPLQRSKSIMSGSFRRSSSKQAAAFDAEAGGEDQPDWDIAHGGPLQATGSSNIGTAVSANPTEATGGTNGRTAMVNESTV